MMKKKKKEKMNNIFSNIFYLEIILVIYKVWAKCIKTESCKISNFNI